MAKFKLFCGILRCLLCIGTLPSDSTTDIPTTTTTTTTTDILTTTTSTTTDIPTTTTTTTTTKTPGVVARLMGLDSLPESKKVFRRKEGQKEKGFLRPKSREPKEKAKEITRKMRGSLRGEPMDLPSILEGYAGDESSYNVSGSDSGSESEFPLGISRRDGWKDSIRISSGSRSFAASCISFGGPKTNMQCETLGQDSYLMAGEAMNRGKNKAIRRNSNKKEDCSSRKIRSNNKKSQSSRRTYRDSTDSFGEEQFNLSQVEINLEKKDPAEQMSLVSHMWTHNINDKSSINDAEVDGGHADMYSESLDEELPSKSSSCLLGNPTSSTPGPEDSKAQVPQIGPSEDETVQLQCPVLEPQSPASAKEADHPSLVLVLEAPFVEDVNIISPGSECFERVNADLHGLRMQLKLLKMESRANADGLMLTPSDKDVGQGFVSVSKDNEVFDDESWESVYLADVLNASGYDDADPDTFVSTWYSLDCPLDPCLFDNVEEKYSSETTSLRFERKLLFDRINSGLFEMFHQFVDPLPWVKQPIGKVGLTRQKHGIGYKLHKLLASEEKSMHEDMTERVLDRKMQWLDSGDGVDAIGMEIEKLLMDDLIVELLASEEKSMHEDVTERVLDREMQWLDSGDETVQLQCPVLEPQSPASAKEADHPSLVSVLEAPFVEDVNIISPGSECFERVNADLHGLRMQLKLLKMESRANADGLMLTPSDKDVGQGFVSVSEDNEVFDDESWESVYLADVLIASGYDDADPDTFVSTWYSLDCPLDPCLFDKVEEKYSSETTSLRFERKLLFDRINSRLFETFHQFVDPLPWVKQPIGKVGLTRQKHGIGYELHKLLASEEKSMHKDMTERVLDRKMQWLDSGDGVDAIGMEIEKLLMDDLIVELLASEEKSMHGDVTERVLDK